MSRRSHRRRSHRHSLSGLFDTRNKWVWAGVGAAALVLYTYRKQLFGSAAKTPSMMGLGYMAPMYNTGATLQGWR